MPDNDIFAPPSKEELSMFAAPSKEELAGLKGPAPSEAGSADVAGLESRLQGLIKEGKEEPISSGAIKGLTFGMSPNIGAAGDVAGDVLTGKQGAEGLGSKWRQYQQSRVASNKDIESAHPYLFGAGELAGGLGGAMLTPELGIGKGLVGAAGKVAPGAAEFLAGQAPSLTGKIAGKATASAIEGAPIGAAYGFGSSDATIEGSPGELAKDTLSGAGMGSLGGAALTVGAQSLKGAAQGAASKAGSMLENSDFLRKMGATYDVGKKGIDLSSTRGKDIADTMIAKGIPNTIVNKIMAVDEQLGTKVGDALQAAQDNGLKINIDSDLEDSTKKLFGTFLENPSLMDTIDPKSKAVIQTIYKKGAGDLTPMEARDLKNTLYDLTGKLSGLSSDSANLARMQGTKLAQAIDQNIKAAIPEYGTASEQFKQFRSMIPETILQPGVPLDKRGSDSWLGSLKDKESGLLDATRNMFGSAQLPGKISTMPRAGLVELQQNLRTLQRTNPAAVQGLGGTAEEVGQNLRSKADMMAALQQAKGTAPHEGLKKTMFDQVVGGGEGLALNISNKVGRAATTAGQSAPVQISTRLYSAGNDALMGLAQKLKGGKGTDFLGNALESALTRKDDTAKNAVLFRMLQDPTYRGMLKGQGYSEDDLK